MKQNHVLSYIQENPELIELYETLRSEGEGGEDASSALAAMMSSISNSGYQLIISAPTPQPVKDQVYGYQEFHSCTMGRGGGY